MSGENLIVWQSKTVGGVLKYTPRKIDGKAPSSLENVILKPLAAWLESHPCIGARQLGSEKTFYSCLPGDMSEISASLNLLHCLDRYFDETDGSDPVFKSLLCVFREPISTQEEFFQKFWAFAQMTHDLDFLTHGWQEGVGQHVNDENFELCFRGRAVFPATFHPAHPRPARRFGYPGWAHNQSSQFDILRETGQFEDWQRKIRKADSRLEPSGTHNPLLSEKGEQSAAAQMAQLKADAYPFLVRRTEDRRELIANLRARAHAQMAQDVLDYIEQVE